MADDIFGRDMYIGRIKLFAESHTVGNQAFLGVKGVGKTSLFQSFFTRKKRLELAEVYKKLFVFTQLDSRKKGIDLYQYLLEQVKIGMMVISDADVKREMKDEMTEIDGIFETPDGRLNQYLSVIKEHGYDLIIIMDQFHCMARDTEIGKEQYDVLRSYNEQKLITYWVITDTDLMETCATKQYIASFFAQKFTNKMTICPIEKTAGMDVVNSFGEQKKVRLTDTEKQMICDVSGGIPELISILVDIIPLAKSELADIDQQSLSAYAIDNSGCASLFEGWITGLNTEQKRILYDVALSGESGQCEDAVTDISKMAELSDEVGRGLLHVEKQRGGKAWFINIPLFQNYIINCGDSFLSEQTDRETKAMEKEAEQRITNIYNISGSFIQSQTNNILNIENAVAGLEDLQKLVIGNPVLLDGDQAVKKLECLPFRQDAWTQMDEDEQEAELEKYADGVFASDIFSKGILTDEQKAQFSLSDELLGALSDSCRSQIVCGVQIYDLIQLCIDNFGLRMDESESPRGILFARAFERHLKDFAAPAFMRIPEFATQIVYPTTKRFKDYPLNKTTIGTYSAMLRYNKSYCILAKASVELLGRNERDVQWWKQISSRLSIIGDLRNQCCHSGTTFGNEHLTNMIDKIFHSGTMEDILIFGEIPQLSAGQFLSPSNVSASITGAGKNLKTKGRNTYEI